MNYYLQHRYQDSGWENINEECSHLDTAKHRAHEFSKDPIAYGMVRVVNRATGTVEVTYPAGGGESWKEDLPKSSETKSGELWKEDLPKPPEIKSNELWKEYVVMIDGLTGKATISICGLCGNTGRISALNGVVTPRGDLVPTINLPCICPNGRVIKAQNENAD